MRYLAILRERMMKRILATTALAALLGAGLTVPTYAMSHESASEARKTFNAALDKCEDMHKDQRQDCMNAAMEQYRMAREKEMEMKKN